MLPECELAFSSQSNILEAMNITSIVLGQHYTGRSLICTGHTLIVLTFGQGQYYVNYLYFIIILILLLLNQSDRELYKALKKNTLLNNISSQIISFRKKSDFDAPMFIFDKEGRCQLQEQKETIEREDISDNLLYECIERQILEE